MNTKKYFVVISSVFFIFFAFPSFAKADVTINEVMYDLDGGDIDFVEIKNNGADIDLTSLKVFSSSSTSNHGIVKYSGSALLHSGEYGIIVASSAISNYTSKWGSSGNIFTSNFTLPNDAGTVSINSGDKNSPIDSLSYSSSDGASGDGNSLQESAGSWISAAPTPGKININSTSSTSDTTTSDTSNTQSTTTTDTTPAKKVPIVYKISTKIISDTKAVAGIPEDFSSVTLGTDHQNAFHGKWVWNFGDGTSRQDLTGPQSFTHRYLYSGEYVVTLEYNETVFPVIPDATSTIVINVTVPRVIISNVFYDDNGGIELSNTSGMDMDISGWMLGSDQSVFMFPKNTIVLQNKKLILAGHELGIDTKENQAISLLYPDNTLASVFPLNTKEIFARVSKKSNKVSTTNVVSEPTIVVSAPSALIANDALTASLGSADISTNLSKKERWIFPSFAGLVIAGAGTTLYIRRKKAKRDKTLADEFEIVE